MVPGRMLPGTHAVTINNIQFLHPAMDGENGCICWNSICRERYAYRPTIFPKICFFPSSYRWITTITVSPVLKSESS